ncbi:MAG: AAA family ATPase [Phycisphaeraceae bacterium]|nr:MAG: AAA family ATPase [Phycisphaeraceae bacterium]
MAPPPFIMLMGLRGSGKSTVGRLLAARLGLGFADLDDLTAAGLEKPNAGAAIRAHGFEAFRKAEAAALGRVLSREGLVLALGGGTPTAPGAADLLRDRVRSGAELVYLHASPDELRRRLESTDTASRPSLTGAGTLDEIARVYLERDPAYRALCTRVVETEGREASEIAEDVLQREGREGLRGRD